MSKKLYCMNCFTEIDPAVGSCSRCGWMDAGQVRHALPFGTVLSDKYLIGQAVRVNGAGFTYAALEHKTNQKVEIREFFPTNIAFRDQNGCTVHPAGGAELKYSDYLSEYERYMQKLIRVSGVQRIPPVLDSFSAHNTQYVVFEYRESISLRTYIEQNGPQPWETVEHWFFPVIQVLGELHSRNVDHLGISPDTLRLTRDDKMILTEFEMQSVRRAGTDLMEDMVPGCWAVEQYSKTKICDEVTDVYGLCACMLFALTGALPMDATKRKQDPRLMIARSILKTLPEPVIPAIANALQVDADRRTSSFSRFAAELTAEPTVMEKVVETQTLRSLPTGSTRSPKTKTLPPFGWLVVSFVVSLAAICIITGVWFKDSAFSPQSILAAFEEPEVSTVSQTIKLPNLVGMTYEEVLALTKSSPEYAFELKVYEENFNETVPAGEITDQLPFAQSLIKVGDTVKVAVSRGSANRTLPEIANLSADIAAQLLEEVGFEPVEVPTVNEEVAWGRVVGYVSGAPGDKAAYGSVVQILVSTDPAEIEPEE